MKDKLTTIKEFLLDWETWRYQNIQIAESTSVHAVKWTKCRIDKSLKAYPILARYDRSVKKKITSYAYAAKVWVLLRYLIRVLCNGQEVKSRQVLYTAIPGIPNTTLRKMVDDLCLTLKIHPYSLLLDVEQTGRMSVGEDVKLSLYVIHNLARASETFNSAGRRLAGTEAVHADKECCNRLSLSSETPHVIPSKVYGIAKYSTSSIKAVLVVEHRNVGVQSNWFRANMKNVLMVMTGGYPSIATREFLCLLWSYFTSTVVRVPPFYFCSDHDPWAFHIFFLLKYGARKTAAMSTSLVCPTLEWVGPTREDVLQEAENYYTSDWPNENRLRSNADAKNEHADAKIELAKCKAKLIARMSKEPTAEAKNLIKALGTRGYTELEPTVAEEMQAILDGKATFSLAILSEIEMGRMESFLVRTANRETGHRVTEATRRRLTETQMPYDALSIRIARYQMEMANNSLLQDLSCSYSQHDSKNLVSINTFSNAPEEVTQMSLPPYQLPEGADDDAFHELWQITLRVFEIRDQEILRSMSKRRSNEVYRRTAGAILLGLNILEGVAKQRLSTPYCREMKWWTKAYLHAGMRWQWLNQQKYVQDIMSPYCGNFKNLELVYKMAYCDFEMLRKQTLIDRDDYPLWHWQDIRGVWRLVQIACNYSTSAEPIIVKRCIGVLAWLDRQIAALEAR